MEEAMREQVRAFAARGLESLEQEDLPDARGNLVLTCEALRDRKGAETCSVTPVSGSVLRYLKST